ncbi:phosphate ABC transporter substrate-binding protein [Oceanidesulfovibrio indonesiensis]|uniref:Phosphate ABC transporter substrate-binding protein n=1 Tax=Oceanidesulfovibrio indonesiensis TaxID=54767 RepID=A0A7M3MJU3_9BACT|nr:PstS family phosphate ABC transporter substrate-binding protein [Oceanidesulfovibrio indonesiensis]TVM19838.1 phosphate ABC transporter substrate-binding protein [Oceanidesulfovibrio indonesiensis]
MRNVIFVLAALAVLLSFSGIANAQARNHISIVGSSTVYPFATVVAEQFGKTTDFPTPKIESTGSGGGFKLFCAGVGVEHPDITNASRRMKKSEFEQCQANGVQDVVEVKIGYDGIVFANSKQAGQLDLTTQQIFLALAKKVPAKDGSETLVDNPYQTWSEIDSSLPNTKIEVLGPPPTSGTRDAFVELVMETGAESFEFIKNMDSKEFKSVAHTVREDGAYVEAGENDNLIVQKLQSNPAAFGIFGFSFLDQNMDKIQGSKIGGVAPTFDAIADGSYPVSRSLQFYVKKAHVGTIPGIQEYLGEFTNEQAWGPDGYLSEKGMIPMPENERSKFAENAKELTPMTASDF